MDILDFDTFSKVEQTVFKNGMILFNNDYIPFYMQHDIYFLSSATGHVFSIDRLVTAKCPIIDILQITTQENLVICNDRRHIYICDDDFQVLNTYEMSNITNFIVLGHDVIFKCMNNSILYYINITTRNLDEYNHTHNTVTDDISGYMKHNEYIICDTSMCPVTMYENFKYGGSKMRASHVIQMHYSKVFENIEIVTSQKTKMNLYDIFEKQMPFITSSTINKEMNKDDRDNIMQLFSPRHVKQFIKKNDVYTRDEFNNNRIILSDENDYIDANVKQLIDEIVSGLFECEYIPAGPFYYYAPLHALGWHTNMETCPSSYRMYTVYCEENYKSYFCYLHPHSKLIHVIGDKTMYVEIFNIGLKDMPIWHAVINPSEHVKRLSLGFLLEKDINKVLTNKQVDTLTSRYSSCLFAV
jgi:hypothetical protein